MLQTLSKFAFIAFLFLIFSGFNNPETVVFSTSKTEFLDELRVFMEGTKNKEHILLFEQFAGQVENNKFTDPEFGEIVEICNKMGEKRMTASPYYTEYLKGLNVVKFNQVGKDNFMDWHGTLSEFLTDLSKANFRKYKSYLIFSQKLFNGKALHKAKGGIDWSANAPTPAVLWEQNEPVIKYLETDLTAVKKNLEISIKGTSGRFYPLQNKWVGQGGVVSWSRISKNIDAEAELSTYEINMANGHYVAENAKLSYPKFFGNKIIVGQLKDKILAVSGNRKSSYPRFQSGKESVSLNMGEGLVYEGGFKLEGVKVEGSANEGETCSLVHRDKAGKITYRLAGNYFTLDDEEFVNAKNVEAVLYFGQDSIYHPGINSKSDIKKNFLALSKGEKAISKAPFFDSYHQVYINTDKLNWYPLEQKLMVNETRIKSGAGSQTVLIESEDFYSEKYIRRIQNVADYNPIVKLMVLAKAEGKELSADAVAKHFNPNFDVANIQSLLFDLEESGFIRFFPKENRVIVYDKIFRYAEVHAGKRDFDVLKMKSVVGGGNAEIDFNKQEMKLKGVKQLEFSDRQKVAAIPTGKELMIGENREVDFDGTLYAGFATLTGSQYNFDYEKFWIKSDSIRFLDFYLPQENGDAFAIGSRIEHAAGTVLIDAPANKSGREDLTIFPSFKSKGNSFVFYDQDNKLGDAYPRDEFFFELKPFFFQGLRQITPEQFELKGKMVTAGIFPEFEETLRLQEDKSLGFTTTAPAEGYNIFKEKGNFKGDMVLSNAGLRGKGDLSYQKTDINSEDIVFRPDNLSCSAKNFDLKEDKTAGLPRVNGANVSINWQPYADSMYVQSKEKSFDVFAETKHTVDGTLIYTPGGLKGKGKFKWNEGEMDSKMFDFGHYSVKADTTNLQIKALETDALAFDTKNVSGVMDFEKQFGNFKANDKDAITTMPHNQYETSLNEFEWNLGKKNITFIAEEGQLGTFTSTDSKQKELTFEGATGQYDFPTGRLNIGGVPFIKSADAFIYPNEGNLTVLPGGQMEDLKDARILASRENKYHEIKRATIKVHSKDKFTGKGFYDYNIGEMVQEIPFTSIVGQRVGKRTDNKVETVAEAVVGESTPFLMGNGFNFSGGIELRSSTPDLGYKGYAQFKSTILANPRHFYVDCRADKNDLRLELDKPKDKEGQRVHTGIYINQETRQHYTRLMMPLESRKDHAFIDVAGMTYYNAEKDEFIVGDSLKVMNPNAKGNLVIFNEKDGSLKGKGTLNFASNLKGPSIKTIGIIKSGLSEGELTKAELASDDLSAKVAVALQFGLPKELKNMIAVDFQSASFEGQTIQYRDIETYETVLPELVSDAKKLPQSLQQLSQGNTFGIPVEDCDFNFLLTELEMTWDADYQSFISSKKQFGLAAIEKKGYHKMIKGAVEFKMPANGEDQFTVLMTSPGGNYYFFNYKNGILSTYSSYAPYNAEVEGMKDKERITKLAGGSFELQAGTTQMVSNFKSRAEAMQK